MAPVLNTVHAGFVFGIFGETDLLEYAQRDPSLEEKCERLVTTLLKGNYRVEDTISLPLHELFQEVLNEVEEKFGLKIPRSPEEYK